MKYCLIKLFFLLRLFPFSSSGVPISKSISPFGSFHCKVEGKFEDPFDDTCMQYFLCSKFGNELVEVQFICSEGTYYDPVNNRCSSHYICEKMVTNFVFHTTPARRKSGDKRNELSLKLSALLNRTTEWTNIRVSPFSGMISRNQKFDSIFKNTIDNENNIANNIRIVLSKIKNQHNAESKSKLATRYKSAMFKYDEYNLTINDIATKQIEVLQNCSAGENFTCCSTGRFANQSDTTCKSYIYCYLWSDGRVVSYDYICSIGLFNPNTQSCDNSYVCPYSTQSTSTHEYETSFSDTDVNTTKSTSQEYCSVGGNFTCSVNGRFPSPMDTSCKSYYYCYVWLDGTIRQYEYICSIGLFNPYTQSCDPWYICPCIEPTSTPILTNFSSTTNTSITVATTLGYCDEETIFTCHETGRFRNPNDTSCKSYIYCYVWSNGSVRQYEYTCSVGLFNPYTRSCDISYVCPCIDGITDETSTSITTETSSLLLSTAEYCSTGDIFKCVETGRFPNPNVTNCKSYIYCYVWSNGSIRQYEYACSIGLFNPYTGSCDISYVCPCIDSITIETSTSIITEMSTFSLSTAEYCSTGKIFTCVETGRFPNPNDTNCKSYTYCYVWSNGSVGQYEYTCSVGLFNPYTGSCDISYVCPCIDNITTETSTSIITEMSTFPLSTVKYCSAGELFTCVETGRFPNPNDTNCKSYIYCYVWSNGSVRQYEYTCSVGLFNPYTGCCDISYICPCIDGITVETSTSITTETSTLLLSTAEYCSSGDIFTCVETGRFPNPNDTSCKSYIYCYVWSDGRVGQYEYICSIGLFNPYAQSCDFSYICPCVDSTAVDTSTSTTREITTSSLSTANYCSGKWNFTCVETGRFPNPNDISCRSYVYCYKWSNGTIVENEYTCSNGLFNPATQSCDPSYACPCTGITLPQTSVNPSSNTVINTVTSTTTNLCFVDEHFTCIESGRYPNTNDTSCKSYIYCYLWSDGSIRQYSYICSIGLFNPNTQSCDPHYVCSCTPS